MNVSCHERVIAARRTAVSLKQAQSALKEN
jgi:hypothetical protein